MKKKIVIIISIFIIGLGMAFLSGLACSWHTRSISVVMDKTPTTIRSSSGQVKPAMGRLPLYFIQNRGQADPRARFTLRGGGQTVHLTENGLLFDFLHYEKPDQDNRRASPVPLKGRRLVVGLDFAGANLRPEIAGRALTLLHYGSYEELGRSYQRLYETCRGKNLEVVLPIREQYLKGPGMIFRGNPKRYVTKLIFQVQS